MEQILRPLKALLATNVNPMRPEPNSHTEGGIGSFGIGVPFFSTEANGLTLVDSDGLKKKGMLYRSTASIASTR